MNYQPLIDNLPMILVALGFLLWATARFFEARAKANPEIDKWDEWAPKIQWASSMYGQALDWLCDANVLKLKGKEKLKELRRLVDEFEKAIESGNYKDAISAVWGYYIDAKAKLNKVSANPLTADTVAKE